MALVCTPVHEGTMMQPLDFWGRLYWRLGLRQLGNYVLDRWADGNIMRTPVRYFPGIDELERYLSLRFQYRHDELTLRCGVYRWVIPTDWVSDPEVVQTKLSMANVRDGDCDDIHYYVGRALLNMPGVDVNNVYLLSTRYYKEGHATTVWRDDAGDWHHYDYRHYALPLGPDTAPDSVAERYSRSQTDRSAHWWCWERITFEGLAYVAMSPGLLGAVYRNRLSKNTKGAKT